MRQGIDTGILLDSGTNEIEILEFTIAKDTFGINVAKVKEILRDSPVKPMPHAHPSIEGVFKPREDLLTVINLPHYLGLEEIPLHKSLFIVTSFNHMNVAFRVDTVVGINRISWGDIEKPNSTIYGGDDGVATGIANCGGRLITILDFEKIVVDIAPSSGIQASEIEGLGEREVDNRPIIIAEDSMLLSKMIVGCLSAAGYVNVQHFSNGEEAWNYLIEIHKSGHAVKDEVACIITDIEMPQMDGHRLTKLIKTHEAMKNIPLIIFSSLIDDQMRQKGESLGADAQLSKPEIGNLVKIIDRLIVNYDTASSI